MFRCLSDREVGSGNGITGYGGRTKPKEDFYVHIEKEVHRRIQGARRPGWMDSVIDERLWCSLKYECQYLREMETGSELRRILV